jgi:hypothetical protein
MWRWVFIAVQTAVFVAFSIAVTLLFGFGISIEPESEPLNIALGMCFPARAGHL